MITIDAGRCNGCGLCIELCPNRAIYLVDNLATVDSTLCSDCGACLSACPTDAIALPLANPPAVDPVPIGSAAPAVVRIRPPAAPISLREQVLPVVGASLAWVSRELLPLLVDILDGLDRQKQRAAAQRGQPSPSRRGPGCPGGQGRGKRRRRRRRDGS